MGGNIVPELRHADRQTDRCDAANTRISGALRRGCANNYGQIKLKTNSLKRKLWRFAGKSEFRPAFHKVLRYCQQCH
jgi:hypothetical protein